MYNKYSSYDSRPSPGGNKRRRDDDESDFQRGRRAPPHIQKLIQLRRAIVEIGEPSKFKISEEIQKLGKDLGACDTDTRNGVLNTILAVVNEQPHKIPLLSGAVQIANAESEILGQVVIELAQSEIQKALNGGELNKVKLLIRFIASLAPIIEGDGVTEILSALLSIACDLQNEAINSDKGSKKSLVAEELYVAVLLALPFYVAADPLNIPYANEILKTSTERFQIGSFQAMNLIVPFSNGTSTIDAPYVAQEFVRLVKHALENIHSEYSDQWKTSNLLDIGSIVKESLNQPTESEDDQQAKSVKKHLFAAVHLPTLDTFKSFQPRFPYPRIYFQAYLPSVFETVPPPNSLEGVILRDIATDIITAMDFNRKEVTRQLITLDLFFADGCFTEPGISFDRLEKVRESGEEKSTWKVEDVALEAVLQHIFNLPYQSHAPAYYYTILIEACVMAPQAIAPVFGRAIRFIYKNLESLDVELVFRFLDWFGVHLSNFSFTWKWKEWEADLKLTENHPKQVFIRQLIEKELRLSYPERLRDTLPEEFKPLLRLIPSEPIFKYYEADSKYETEVRQLVAALRSKKSDEIQNAINVLREKALGESVGEHATELDRTLIDILVTTICYLGNRSLSHSKNWVSQTAEVLKGFITSSEDELTAIKSIVSYWTDLPHVGKWVMRHFVEANVLTDSSVTDYLLQGNEGLAPIVSCDGWEQFSWVMDKYDSSDDVAIQKTSRIISKLGLLLDQNSDDSDESSQWATWWYRGVAKSLFRKYPKLFTKARTQTGTVDKFLEDLFPALDELAELSSKSDLASTSSVVEINGEDQTLADGKELEPDMAKSNDNRPPEEPEPMDKD
ncbi:Sto1p [Sugiyamaella lignohabitans]|uniref:Sto1p n=1 Tax=Sugiyamaella lignohabitans TaxID=796027 RepID=A0A170QZN0_9ASCO|nr:Sto1p [Sugiyamaella lignohabitans]ANB16018.1 Sto1p [Sugiyamaella lignohabitans]